MRIVVVGSGSMGSLFGAHLSRTDAEVVCYDVDQDHVDAMNRDGLVIESNGGPDERVPVTATTDPTTIDSADLVILFVKSIHTVDALESATAFLTEETDVLTLQNGFRNPHVIAEYVPESNVIVGTTTASAELVGPGTLANTDPDVVTIGRYFDENDAFVEDVSALLERAGFDVSVSASIRDDVWEKLLINLTLNPITALTGMRVGEAVTDPESRELIEALVEETVRVGRARGVTFRDDPVEYVVTVAKRNPEHKTSMRHDVEAGNPTEIDHLSGALVEYARDEGIAVPHQRTISTLVSLRE
ncbi:ketopantoate reductase family protein [Natrarchaeobius oligotrophus]|uniref:2-dehydropantoate 2-reductase n=1 Tax=Natrarchaeobius chitinivorans TaxID=1679083 RepID=A0A3N6NRE8_NATCH|nr:2-dehydropantoate 2-reductase [Natrarchaeobius chitinivorans]RQH02603.1 2-dehydropantoate 2-reductase [Natrarchaeobius chitinivorans]